MQSFTLDIVDRHPIVHFPEGKALIDTGSPLTIAAPAIVGQALGPDVKRLIGVDRLRSAPVLLDYVGGQYVEDTPLPVEGETVALDCVLGVYRISCAFQGEPVAAFLDTGAKLSYADPCAVSGMTPVGVERDFYPLVGHFDVPVYDLTIDVAGRQVRGRFGVLPDLLRLALEAQGLGGWILGSDYFLGRRIVLDFAHDRLIDVTDVANPDAATPRTSGLGECCSRSGVPSDKMRKAYGAAQLVIDAELSTADRSLLSGLRSHDVVVVRGVYDRVEDVLRLARIPFRLVEPEELETTPLSPEQLVILNCPGKVSPQALSRLRGFVEMGGSLITTDWALTHVLERAFPGFIEYNHTATGDEVVRIEVQDASSPWIAGMFSERSDPVWWLEGASYPIRVIDRERVRVLLTSTELGARYGEAPVAVAFNVGKGDVLHMISHYYLQRSELRTARHRQSWKSYACEVGVAEAVKGAPSLFDDVMAGEVETAHKSLRFMTNMVLEKQRKNRQRI